MKLTGAGSVHIDTPVKVPKGAIVYSGQCNRAHSSVFELLDFLRNSFQIGEGREIDTERTRILVIHSSDLTEMELIEDPEGYREREEAFANRSKH